MLFHLCRRIGRFRPQAASKCVLLCFCIAVFTEDAESREHWFHTCFEAGKRNDGKELVWVPSAHELKSPVRGQVARLPLLSEGEQYVVDGIRDRWLLFVVVKSPDGSTKEGSGLLINQPVRDVKVGDVIKPELLYCYQGMRQYQGSLADEVKNTRSHLLGKEFPCFELILQRRSQSFVDYVVRQNAKDREWVDDTGTYRTKARLLDIVDGTIQLDVGAEKSVDVPTKRLSKKDKVYIEQFRAFTEKLHKHIPRKYTAFLDESHFDETYVARSLPACQRFTLDTIELKFGPFITLSAKQIDDYDLFPLKVGTEVEIVHIHYLSDIGTFFELRDLDEKHGRFYASQLGLYFDVMQTGPPRLR